VKIKGIPVEIQIPAHWNLNGRSMTAPLPVYRPTVFLYNLHVIALSFHQGKIRQAFQNCYGFIFYCF
jgi:hypothetical protein